MESSREEDSDVSFSSSALTLPVCPSCVCVLGANDSPPFPASSSWNHQSCETQPEHPACSREPSEFPKKTEDTCPLDGKEDGRRRRVGFLQKTGEDLEDNCCSPRGSPGPGRAPPSASIPAGAAGGEDGETEAGERWMGGSRDVRSTQEVFICLKVDGRSPVFELVASFPLSI